MTRILYSGTRNASSWSFRAWLSMRELDICFEEIIVDIRRPQRWKNLAEIGNFSPPAAIPVLVDDETVIYDSFAIMEYVNELGGGTLLPKDMKQRAQARSLIAWQHSNFANVCSSLSFESAFYKEKKQLSANEKIRTKWVYSIWEESLKRHEGDYLVGEFSLADIALLPSVLRLKAHCQVPKEYFLTIAWMQRLINRPHVQEWLKEAYALEPIYCAGYKS